MQENKIPFELVKDDNYRTIYVNGVFGGLDPVEGRMIFYIDEIEPEMDENTPGKMKVKKIVRRLLVDIRMSPAQFKSIADWMQSHIERFDRELREDTEKEFRKF